MRDQHCESSLGRTKIAVHNRSGPRAHHVARSRVCRLTHCSRTINLYYIRLDEGEVSTRRKPFIGLIFLLLLLVPVVLLGCAGSTSADATKSATIPAPATPLIIGQPTNQTVTVGQTATFSVIIYSTAQLNYQWQKNGTAIGGAIAASYTTPVTATSDNGSQFTVAVANSAGSVTSSAAVLTVTTAPVAPAISTQPVSRTVTAGQAASFSVAATGTAPLNYQWMKNGTPIAGSTSASYSTPATAISDTGSQFTVTVSNLAGNVTSSAATLTVNAVPGQLTASVSTLSFGNVNIGTSTSQSVMFTNSGNANITISNVTFLGAGFNVSGLSNGLILSPLQTATLTVTSCSCRHRECDR